MKLNELFEAAGLDLPTIVAELKKSKTIEDASLKNTAIELSTVKGDMLTLELKGNALYAWVQGQKNDIDCGNIGNSTADILAFLKGINKSWYREYDKHFNE